MFAVSRINIIILAKVYIIGNTALNYRGGGGGYYSRLKNFPTIDAKKINESLMRTKNITVSTHNEENRE